MTQATLGWPGQPLGDRQRVVAVALHAQRQRLDPGQDQEGVERRDRRAEVAQAEHARGDGEGEIAEGLVQHDAAIFRARLRQHRIVARLRPVEGAAIDDDAADRIAVAADELGQRMHDDVGAMLDRPHQIGRGQRVVDDQRQAVLVGDRRRSPRCRRTSPPGLAMLSMKIACVLSSIAFSKVETSSVSAQRTCQSKFLKEWLNWLIEPP